MKITKKELKGIWESFKNSPFGWSIYCVYIFEYKGKLKAFIQFNGQGTLDVIYNSKVVYKSYDVVELFSDFTNCKHAVEYAKNLIDSTWSK